MLLKPPLLQIEKGLSPSVQTHSIPSKKQLTPASFLFGFLTNSGPYQILALKSPTPSTLCSDPKEKGESLSSSLQKPSHSLQEKLIILFDKMPSPFSIFSRITTTKSKNIPFKDYYTNWFNTLKDKLLPLLHQSLSSPSTSSTLLSSHLHLLLHHILTYYDSLDLAASTNTNNLPYLLYPSWRNPLEKPFLFLGDLHPYVFTNLLRFSLDEADNDEDAENDHKVLIFDRPCQVVMAWKDPSKHLIVKIEQIERGLRLMVPALLDRVKRAQSGFVAKVAEEWVNCEGKKEKLDVSEAMKVQMEELVSVFVDANRLRRSVITEIVGALNAYQGALFLEGLAQFLVGFKDKNLLREFESCKVAIEERVGLSI